jgi:hypothetical protein
MSSVIISGDTSGAITLSAPAVAGTNTLSLPAQTATIATLTTPSFATTIGVGGATASASGSGISFPATQSSSSDANTLDDYEEGTWTPTDGSGAGLSFTVYDATYTKIGKVVMFEVSIFYPTTVSSASTKISGLPFTCASGSDNTGAFTLGGTSVGANYYWQVNRGSTSFTGATNLNTDATNANMSGKFIKGFGWYHV